MVERHTPPRAQQWDADLYGVSSSFQTDEGRDLLGRLAIRGGERVLDVGCGDGRVTQLLRAAGATPVGIDPSLSMAAAARRRGVLAIAARAEALPFGDLSFDAVVSNAALHWSLDHERCVAELVRVLNHGGRLFVRVGGPGNQWRVFAETERLFCTPPFARYRPVGFRLPLRNAEPHLWMAALAERGMQVDAFDVLTAGPGWSDPSQMRRWLEPILGSCTALLPPDLAAPFLDNIVARVWPKLDPAACFVRLVVAARRPSL